MAVNYKIDGIAHSERLKLLQLGDKFLLAPASMAIINYCHLAKIPELKTDNDINELWFRINYMRGFGFEIWPSQNGKQHVFEPYFDDLSVHKGLVLPDTKYVARKQWINQSIDLFIENNTIVSENSKMLKLSQDVLVAREELHDAYIEQETGRKSSDVKPVSNPLKPGEQPAKNNSNTKKGDIPDIVLKQHNENLLNIAIEKRRKGAILNEDETKLLQKFIEEDPDRAAQILNKKPTIESAISSQQPAVNVKNEHVSDQLKDTLGKINKKVVKNTKKPVKSNKKTNNKRKK